MFCWIVSNQPPECLKESNIARDSRKIIQIRVKNDEAHGFGILGYRRDDENEKRLQIGNFRNERRNSSTQITISNWIVKAKSWAELVKSENSFDGLVLSNRANAGIGAQIE